MTKMKIQKQKQEETQKKHDLVKKKLEEENQQLVEM